jgi:hypothetical protein
MDEAVDQIMGRSQDEKGADKAVGLRRSQQKERARLQSEISAEQKTIAGLTEERAPIAADIRKVEAEVGPIKYIAALIYGNNTDTNLLEKAVTWVIMVIVLVFDPLAVLLLLASQMTWQWYKRDKEIDHERQHLQEMTDVVEEESKEELTTDSTPEDLIKKPIVKFSDGGEHPKDSFDHEHEEKQSIEILPEVYEPDYLAVGKKEIELPSPETSEKGQRYRIVKNGSETYYEFDGETWIDED